MQFGWGYFQCNGTIDSLETPLLIVLDATKVAPDRFTSGIDYLKLADLLQMMDGLEPYGYKLDEDLQVSISSYGISLTCCECALWLNFEMITVYDYSTGCSGNSC